MNLKFWKHFKWTNKSSLARKWRNFLAEFFGTSILLFMGCMGSTRGRVDTLLEGTFSFGTAVMVAIQCFGHISGSHINPLITIGALFVGKIAIDDSLVYVLGQLLGATFGTALVRLLVTRSHMYNTKVPLDSQIGFCSDIRHPAITDVQAIFIECTISFVLVFTICAVLDYRNIRKADSISVRFGFTIIGLAIAAAPYTGSHMNPARSFGPALLNNYWDKHYIYWVGQLLGAVMASLIYVIFFYKEEDVVAEDAGEKDEEDEP